MPRRLLPALVVVTALLLPLPSASAAGPDPRAAERTFLVLLNKQRASAGLRPVVLDPSLSAVARAWSARMARERLIHNPGLRRAVESTVARWSRLGENVGVGDGVARLHRAFWASPRHRENVLGAYNRVGIGVAVGSDGLLRVTFDFVQGPAVRGTTGIQACQAGGYVLDAFGAVHAAGGARRLRATAYWRGWDVARDLALPPGDDAGQVLDAFGGLHRLAGAPRVRTRAYWPGWDIARAVVVRPAGHSAYVLDAFGGVHPAGRAPAVRANGYWPGRDVARDLQLLPGRSDAGYVLDAQGGLHRFGAGAPAPRTTWQDPRGRARSFTFLPGGRGGYVTDARGDLHPFAVGRAPLPPAHPSPIPLASAALGALTTGSGPVAVTAGGAEIGLRAGCASPARWGVRNLVRAVAAR